MTNPSGRTISSSLARADFQLNFDFREILNSEFVERQRLRPTYSLRSFASDLKISPALLSAVLNSRGGISAKTATLISELLKFSDDERQHFCDLVAAECSRSPASRLAAKKRLSNSESRPSDLKISSENFDLLSVWHHLPLVELIDIHQGKVQVQLFCDALVIAKTQLREALKNLVKARVLIRLGPGHYKKNQDFAVAESKTPQASVRRYHVESLCRATDAIQRLDMARRKSLTSVFSVRSDDVDDARKFLSRMEQTFVRKYGSKKNPDAAYCLTTQFFEIYRKPRSW